VPIAGQIYREINGTQQNVSAGRITPFATYYYVTQDCTGVPFLQGSDWLPKLAAVDSGRILAPGPDTVIQFNGTPKHFR
jgi:hypothetical protein